MKNIKIYCINVFALQCMKLTPFKLMHQSSLLCTQWLRFQLIASVQVLKKSDIITLSNLQKKINSCV